MNWIPMRPKRRNVALGPRVRALMLTVDDVSCVVSIPAGLENVSWAGSAIRVEVGQDVQFHVVHESLPNTQLLGRKYRPVAVPRLPCSSGKVRNTFAPGRYLALHSGTFYLFGCSEHADKTNTVAQFT